MSKLLKFVVLTCVFIFLPGMAAQQKAASPSAIIEAAHIKGDRVFGFRKSCLLVLSDGRYHRERYAEHSGAGLGQESWDPPQVFEGRLAATETEELMKQIDEPNFTSISGFVGEIPHLTSMLMFFPSGTVTPHEDIDVTVVSIARPQRGQMFQIGDGARRQPGISKFLDWFKSVEKRDATPLPDSEATECASMANGVHGSVPTSLQDRGFKYPHEIRAALPDLRTKPPSKKLTVWFVVNPDGTVGSVRLEGKTTSEVASVLIEAVSQWKFDPARLLGVPVAFPMRDELDFSKKQP